MFFFVRMSRTGWRNGLLSPYKTLDQSLLYDLTFEAELGSTSIYFTMVLVSGPSLFLVYLVLGLRTPSYMSPLQIYSPGHIQWCLL